LLIVGDGPDRKHLEDLASSLELPAQFAGYVPYKHLPNIMREADVFVHAPRSEPWGVSVQEAMASGLPVLASQGVGSATELLPSDRTEWSFEPYDDGKLAQLLESMKDPVRRYRHSRSNHARALERSADAAVQLMMEQLVTTRERIVNSAS